MRDAMSLADFSSLVGVPADELTRLVDLGLLDPDGDGRFDDLDLVRCVTVRDSIGRGRTAEDVAAEVEAGTFAAMYGGRLFARRGTVTIEEAAESTGISVEQLRALYVAAGIPREVLFEEDAVMGDAVSGALAAGLPWDALLELARVMGDALRRVAEATIRVVHVHVHEAMLAEGAEESEVGGIVGSITENAGPLLDPAIRWVYHEHLVQAAIDDAVLHAASAFAPVATLGSFETTILFADVASFTTFVETEGDEAAIRLLDRVGTEIRALALRHRGKLVKELGDGFMLAFGQPDDAVRFAAALLHAVETDPALPALRVGINHGTVVHRADDYLGSAVNIASRVTDAAMAGQALVTEAVARVDAGVAVEPVGARLLRGVDAPIPLWRVVPDARRLDPVCGATVGSDAVLFVDRDGTEHAFCSAECLRRFLSEPDTPAAPTVST